MSKVTAVYTLGKLHSKYLISDIFSYAYARRQALYILFKLAPQFRILVISNYHHIFNWNKIEKDLIEIEFSRISSTSVIMHPG